tara:strand:- start:2131 stop:2391 length:261 start_codon:yes stop_codon:yes gene_type:complete
MEAELGIDGLTSYRMFPIQTIVREEYRVSDRRFTRVNRSFQSFDIAQEIVPSLILRSLVLQAEMFTLRILVQQFRLVFELERDRQV